MFTFFQNQFKIFTWSYNTILVWYWPATIIKLVNIVQINLIRGKRMIKGNIWNICCSSGFLEELFLHSAPLNHFSSYLYYLFYSYSMWLWKLIINILFNSCFLLYFLLQESALHKHILVFSFLNFILLWIGVFYFYFSNQKCIIININWLLKN